MHKIFGFTCLTDYANTMFAVKNKLLFLFSVTFGSITFTDYFWHSYQQIVFLWIMLLLDLATGVWAAVKSKSFTSRKLPRWAGIAFSYSLLLFISYNMSKFTPIFFWLPGSLYGLFVAVQFKSLSENLAKLGFLKIPMLKKINDKIDSVVDSEIDKSKEPDSK